jgi:uncharacterized membrane protein
MHKLFLFISKVPRTLRLLISLAIGLLLFFYFIRKQSPAASFMYAWMGFSASVLFFSWLTIFVNDPKHIATVAVEQDNSRLVIFLFVVVAAFISLFAILLLLRNLPVYTRSGLSYHIFLSIIAVFCSWCLIHTLFTLRYAHLYYSYETHEARDRSMHSGGLEFPGHELPDLLDFAYFSFVLGMTFQVSDVVVSSKHIRRLVLVHGLLSFVYNTAIVALAINILSGIVGK